MKNIILIITGFLFYSCTQQMNNHKYIILDNNSINLENIKKLDVPEKALLSAYLFVYGNECNTSSDKVKCKILNTLQIVDECSESHQKFLQKWFKTEGILYYKLKKCPVLPIKGAIQNQFKTISIERNLDILSITIHVVGMNTSQEKNWNIKQTNSYKIINNSFKKIQ